MEEISRDFLEVVHAQFTPYTFNSGTENVAHVLYWLVRMNRCETVTEFGTGFTTPFLAKALADNLRDYTEHRKILRRRVAENRDSLERLLAHELFQAAEPDEAALRALVNQSFGELIAIEGSPVAANPLYYLRPYEPRLFTWEYHPDSHQYVANLTSLLHRLELTDLVTLTTGAREIGGYLNALPDRHRAVDLAWNDDGHKIRFFEETFASVNAAGGILAFHAPDSFRAEVAVIRSRIAADLNRGSCEIMTLFERHKMVQNGCLLLRKCQPPPISPTLRDALQALAKL